jgi:hypothetical protein
LLPQVRRLRRSPRYSPHMSAGKDRTSWRGFISTLKDRCRQLRWPIVALLGWCLAGFFAVTLTIQRIELQGHLHIAWGNAPEWLSAIATIAAFGALLFAALTWRAGQAERRSRDADQARLIIVEPKDPDIPATAGYRVPLLKERDFVVRNHSPAPIYNVIVQSMTGSIVDTLAMEWVLQPGEATKPITVVSPKPSPLLHQNVRFVFIDSHGRGWSRLGTDQPEPSD